MTPKKEPALVSGTELTKYLKSLGSIASDLAKDKATVHFKNRKILDGIWNLSAAAACLAKPVHKGATPFIEEEEEEVLVENNMQSILAGMLLEKPHLNRIELEDRIGNSISKDTFNRAQIIIGGVTKFQKELFEDFVKTAVHLESLNKPYKHTLNVSEVQKYTRRTDGLRYGRQIRNSPYFHKAVANRLKRLCAPGPEVQQQKVAAIKGYEKISSIVLERGYDALITVNHNGNKVIDIVRLYK